MLAIPMGTDAPIYYWPRATIAIMLLNIVALFAIPPVASEHVFSEDDEIVETSVSNFERYALTLGNGLHPVQWVTHNFLHYGFMHLAGNLLFLWAFGIVVEGKLGALKYLAVYFAIGTLHGAFVQTLLLRSGLSGNAAGASAVVFGLLAVCMVWAPRNELNCTIIFFIGFRIIVHQLDLYYTTVAMLYVGEQVFGIALRGWLGARFIVPEIGHLSGAFWGTVIAMVMVKAQWVDCEGWDLFALAAKRKGLKVAWKEREKSLDRAKTNVKLSVKAVATSATTAKREDANPEQIAANTVQRVQKQINKGDFAAALAAYDKGTRTLVSWPSQADLMALIKAMHAQKAEVDSIRLMRDYCRYYPADAHKVRLKLAQVLIRDRQRPAAALKVLAEIPQGSLSSDLAIACAKLTRQAQRMQEEGVLELEGDD